MNANVAPSYITILILLFHSVEGVKYSDRACCEIGSNTPSEMCSIPDEMIDTINTMRIGIFVGVVIAAQFIWLSFGIFRLFQQIRSRRREHQIREEDSIS